MIQVTLYFKDGNIITIDLDQDVAPGVIKRKDQDQEFVMTEWNVANKTAIYYESIRVPFNTIVKDASTA